jgi:6-O-methylguanine DNA methyltransferase, DNA binding domain
MKMTACQNFEKKRLPKKVMLSSDFAGVKAGLVLYIGTPQIVADYISKIPKGETCSIEKLRNQLARRNGCNAMCPVSTAIFLRIAADYAIDQMKTGTNLKEVIPFWRVISSKDKIASKLKIEPSWLDHQRQLEQSDIQP